MIKQCYEDATGQIQNRENPMGQITCVFKK